MTTTPNGTKRANDFMNVLQRAADQDLIDVGLLREMGKICKDDGLPLGNGMIRVKAGAGLQRDHCTVQPAKRFQQKIRGFFRDPSFENLFSHESARTI